MRISDLSSDVCSSDLNGDQGGQGSRCGAHTSYSRQAGTRSDSPKHSYVSCFLDGTIARECGHGNKDSRLYKSIDLMRVSLIWLWHFSIGPTLFPCVGRGHAGVNNGDRKSVV